MKKKNNFKNGNISIDFNQLNYKKGKFNLISLFSGCGGLDLGFELAGLQAVIGEAEALKAFKDKDLFNSVRDKGIFNTIYANDFFIEATQSYALNFPKHIYIETGDIRKIKDFPKADIVLEDSLAQVF